MSRRKLFPFQVEDARYVAKRLHQGKATLVAHEPRVGKSNVGIRAADNINAKYVLIVCPANVVNNWVLAVEEFRLGGWIAVVVAYTKAADLYVKLKLAKNRITFDLMIIDEAQFAKERNAARTKATYGEECTKWGGLAEFANGFCMTTGTPLPKDPTDLWPMFRAVAPHLIPDKNGRPMSYSAYRNMYCKMIMLPFGMKNAGAKNYTKLRNVLKDDGFVLRRTRQEVYGRDVQPPTCMYVEASAKFRTQLSSAEYKDIDKKVQEALDKGGVQALARLEREFPGIRMIWGLAKVDDVSRTIIEELKADPDMKIIIGCWHTDVIDAYMNAFLGYGAIRFDGRDSGKMKIRNNARFMTDKRARVAVGQLQAMGLGLDFSAANDCVLAEQSWIGVDNQQFAARIFNANSPHPKFVRIATLLGSSDTRISAEAERKIRNADKILV